MKVDVKQIVAALDAAIEDQRRHVVELEVDYEADTSTVWNGRSTSST